MVCDRAVRKQLGKQAPCVWLPLCCIVVPELPVGVKVPGVWVYKSGAEALNEVRHHLVAGLGLFRKSVDALLCFHWFQCRREERKTWATTGFKTERHRGGIQP